MCSRSALLVTTPAVAFYEERDADRSIDVLVLGLEKDARSDLYSLLVALALDHSLSIKFVMAFDQFSVELERSFIDRAKVSCIAT